MKACIFEARSDGDEKLFPQYDDLGDDEAVTKTQELDKATKGLYYVGQDDGKWFFAVDDCFEKELRSVFSYPDFLSVEIKDIQREDYPWDYTP